MYQALYRKWRPSNFDDVCGQSHITDILKYETAEKRISHAYLFCGPRGTGKTSCAKILAKAVNCLSPINGNPCGKCTACRSIDSESATDVLEMDAASNNGVDAVRAIRDEVCYTPQDLKYRVYIVDEVHMLSVSAFNALLKTLEEPPAHVIFILATTELQKLPATIISRCQRFDFHRISTDIMAKRLLYIAENEGIKVTADAAHIIAKQAAGGMRDAISLLDLCSSGGEELTAEFVQNSLGISSAEGLRNLVAAIFKCDYEYIFEYIRSISNSSVDIAVLWQELLSMYRDLLVVKTSKRPELYIDSTSEETIELKKLSELYSPEKLIYHIRTIDDSLAKMQRSGSTKRIIAETTLLKLCDKNLSDDTSALLTRISELEQKVSRLALGLDTVPLTVEKASDTDKKVEPVENVSEEQSQINAETAVKSSGLRRIPYWLELVEELSKEYRSAMGMRDGSKGYIDEKNSSVTIKFTNAFTMNMMAEDSARSALAIKISTHEGRVYRPDSIKYELCSKTEDTDDDFFDSL